MFGCPLWLCLEMGYPMPHLLVQHFGRRELEVGIPSFAIGPIESGGRSKMESGSLPTQVASLVFGHPFFLALDFFFTSAIPS